MDKVSLTASMRSNLLSLQNISRQVDATQNRLSTGKKVNLAIDNPSSYYTARSLSNRASDLDALLDSMGQAVSTIKAATTSLETAADFLEQAAAVATQALEKMSVPDISFFEQQDGVAAVVSDWTGLKAALDSGVKGNIVIYGNIVCKESVSLNEGQNLVGVGYYGSFDSEVDKFSQLNFDLNATGAQNAIKTNADNLLIADLSIKSVMNGEVSSSIIAFGQTSRQVLHNVDLMMDNTFMPDYRTNKISAAAITSGEITLTGKNSIYSLTNQDNVIISYGINVGNTILNGTLNICLSDIFARGIAYGELIVANTSELNIYTMFRGIESCTAAFNDDSLVRIHSCNNGGLVYGDYSFNDNSRVELSGDMAFVAYNGNSFSTILNINSVNSEIAINTNMLFYQEQNGILAFNVVAGSKINLKGKTFAAEKEFHESTATSGNNIPADYKETDEEIAPAEKGLNWLFEKNAERKINYVYTNEITQSGKCYSEILSQYDSLIKDSSYKGVNLLQEQDLKVTFNESRSAWLDVKGKDASSAALGIKTVEWQTQEDVVAAVKELTGALNKIRNMSAELGSYYNIVLNHQDFTENLINVLEEGADKLTLADMNEESANMLALQTRQQLATNSLSLASQAAQSILRLF